MSVPSISSTSGPSPADLQGMFAKVKNDFKSLADALKSGNIGDAQKAYAALQKDMPAKAKDSSATDPNDPLSALGKALQSGDLAGAQQAFAAFRQAHSGHHHHNSSASVASASVASTTGNDGDADDGVGTKLDAVA